MADPFVAEIRIFPFNFAPKGWAWCDGQLMPLSQNTALFSLLGTTYGGDGKSNFALPDLQGRAPMHPGQGPGLSLHDRDGASFYKAGYPQHLFGDFKSIPPLIVNTLLFIEDRSLLDADHPRQNPAVTWHRFALATVGQVGGAVGVGGVPGQVGGAVGQVGAGVSGQVGAGISGDMSASASVRPVTTLADIAARLSVFPLPSARNKF